MDFENEIEKFAQDLDKFSYDYDSYSYKDAYNQGENGIDTIKDDILNGKTDGYRSWLNDIAKDDVDNITRKDAKSLLDRLDSLDEAVKVNGGGKSVVKQLHNHLENDITESNGFHGYHILSR